MKSKSINHELSFNLILKIESEIDFEFNKAQNRLKLRKTKQKKKRILYL